MAPPIKPSIPVFLRPKVRARPEDHQCAQTLKRPPLREGPNLPNDCGKLSLRAFLSWIADVTSWVYHFMDNP